MSALLTIIIPVFNEERTLPLIYERLRRLAEKRRSIQRIYVDDASNDSSRCFLIEKQKKALDDEVFLFHSKNRGKGAAIRTAIPFVVGVYVLIQDADLEYDPDDVERMIDYAVQHNFSVVYGSRNLTIKNQHVSPVFFFGASCLNQLYNVLYQQRITDMNTCYKLIASDLLRRCDLSEDGFAIEAEISVQIAKLGVSIVEQPIHYSPRSFSDGKKIRMRHGMQQALLLLRHWRFGKFLKGDPTSPARRRAEGG